MSAGLSLAVVAGVPLGTLASLVTGWRGPFWMLGALSLLVAVAVYRLAPASVGAPSSPVSVRSEIAAVRPWRTWVVLAVIVLAQAGFLGMYSFISPLLTERAAVPPALVPVVLIGFGVGALIGTAAGGRFGDRHPLATIAVAVLASAFGMLVLASTAQHAAVAVVLVVLLGACGLGANPVLIAQTLQHAGGGSTLASSLATAAFNLGTAGGSALAAVLVSTSMGVTGPAIVGAAITASSLLPLTVLAAYRSRPRRRLERHTPECASAA
jgi:DHA1 family inner membrane transport protein